MALYTSVIPTVPDDGKIIITSTPNTSEDKFAQKFEINLLRCIFCGLCEEACPKGAIYLDGTGEMAADNREDLILTKERMMEKTGGPLIGQRN